MAFDEELAVRVRDVLERRKGIEEKKMFGGTASSFTATCSSESGRTR